MNGCSLILCQNLREVYAFLRQGLIVYVMCSNIYQYRLSLDCDCASSPSLLVFLLLALGLFAPGGVTLPAHSQAP